MKLSKPFLALCGGHFLIDAYSSMLGAFLPFLHERMNLSMTQAGLLAGMLIFSSSLMQPLYGYLADRFRHRIFVALAPGISGLFICSLGLAPNFYALVLLVVLGGVGIASFHPQGAAITSEMPGNRPGYRMSVFITGGMLGHAMGPLYITTLISLAGLQQSYWAAVPGLCMSLYLLTFWSFPRPPVRQQARVRVSHLLRRQLRPLIIHYFLVVIRSTNQMVFVAFLPLYFTLRGHSEAGGGQLLSLFLLTGGIAGLWGGILADRFSGRVVIVASLAGYVPMSLGLLLTDGWISILFCAAAGGFLLLSNPINVVMAQQLVPEASSTISSLMMGFAWGVGGFVIPVIGVLSDWIGLHPVLLGLVLITSPGFLMAYWLPATRMAGGVGPTLVSETATAR